MESESRNTYGEALVISLAQTREASVTPGALALGESFEGLKDRVRLIVEHAKWVPMRLLSLTTACLLGILIALPTRAITPAAIDPQAIVSSAARMSYNWLGEIDSGKSNETWQQMTPNFQKVFNVEQWRRLTAPRSQWGKCQKRVQLLSEIATTIDKSSGYDIPHDWITVRFDSYYEKTSHHWDTVHVTRTDGGTWEINGYVITPQ